MSKPVILTGLRANSEFHIGNFLGAIKPVVTIQSEKSSEYQINMFIPDLHSFTTPIDHGTLYQQTIDNLKVFVAAGLNIDDESTYIYRQSYVPAHSELTWILSCFTYFGELSRMTQFKDKSEAESSKSNPVTAGLFNYPVLMAADILLYDAVYIPVGDDQKQHIELTRDLAIRLNNRFGTIFTEPHAWEDQLRFANRQKGVRIRSLKNPDKKMSKSVNDPSGTIMLSDSPDDAAKKIISATTDSIGVINYDWENQPGITNLLQILALITDTSQSEINETWKNKQNYNELKTVVAKSVSSFLTKLHSSLKDIETEKIIKKLEQDEKVINEVANQKLVKVQTAIGIRPVR